jgi:hypothetical protein
MRVAAPARPGQSSRQAFDLSCGLFGPMEPPFHTLLGGLLTLTSIRRRGSHIVHSLDNRFTDGGKIASPTHRPRSTPQKHYLSASVTHFCYRLSEPQGLVRLKVLSKLKITSSGVEPARLTGDLGGGDRPRPWLKTLQGSTNSQGQLDDASTVYRRFGGTFRLHIQGRRAK